MTRQFLTRSLAMLLAAGGASAGCSDSSSPSGPVGATGTYTVPSIVFGTGAAGNCAAPGFSFAVDSGVAGLTVQGVDSLFIPCDGYAGGPGETVSLSGGAVIGDSLQLSFGQSPVPGSNHFALVIRWRAGARSFAGVSTLTTNDSGEVYIEPFKGSRH